MDAEYSNQDICRFCRAEGSPDRPLFHPCICTGSIKWIHQECLQQWMKYSRKESCEVCSYRFSFTPIYSPDMPRRLPLRDLAVGLFSSVTTAIKYWFHYTLVAIAWIGFVPLTACRIYRALFAGTTEAIFSLPFQMYSMENITSDTFQGCFVVTCTLFAFAGLVWLREQILHGGGPDWLQRENPLLQDVGNLNNNVPDDFGNLAPIQEEVQVGAEQEQNQDAENPEMDDVANLNFDDGAGNDPANDENNPWIPMEWDRAGEEITWERLLGLDGSLKFLEHVFWVISLNTMFIVIFAYFPHHVGKFTLSFLNMRETASASHFEGLLTTLVGYCSVGVIFVMFHRVADFLGCYRARRILGLCYVVVKVSMLSVVEIGLLPLVCGWWLDICSLAMFDASLKDREASFVSAPGTSIFIHWLIGMIYVYYFASFILLLREVLRPGVLWFLRNFNDPEFSPIQEMIHLPILDQIRKLLISAVIFGSVVLLMLWIPIRILKTAFPSFLPYRVSLNNDTHVNELSLELLLLQVILPALLEQGHTRNWLKGFVGGWCKVIAWILNIHSYLLGDNNENSEEAERQAAANAEANNRENQDGGLGAAHQALLMVEPPSGFQPYTRPTFFVARLIGLLISVCISLVISSVLALTVPVWLGRKVMSIWLVSTTPTTTSVSAPTNVTVTEDLTMTLKVHELYTAACGLYLCWLTARAISLVLSWLPQGRAAMMDRLKQWCLIGIKTALASFLLLGLIPLLFGLLLELVVIVPLRVPIHQTPILFIWQDWALGVLYTKIACAITMMGPEWFLRTAIERAYRDGIRDIRVELIMKNIVTPVVACFGLALSIPYVTAYSIVPLFISNLQTRNVIARRIYPFLLLISVVCLIVVFQIKQFKKLYEHIKNDKYLVGQRLVNYDPVPKKAKIS